MFRSQVKKTLSEFVLVVSLIISGGPVIAEVLEPDSAKSALSGCRDYVSGNAKNDDPFKSGFCLGSISSLSYKSKEICLLPGVTQAEAVRAVVQYIDAQPSRINEDFRKLAFEALKAAWPCEKLNYHLKWGAIELRFIA